MTKKVDAFEVIKKEFNMQKEIQKLEEMVFDYPIIKIINNDGWDWSPYYTISIASYINRFCMDWDYFDTCQSCDEFFERLGIVLPLNKCDEKTIKKKAPLLLQIIMNFFLIIINKSEKQELLLEQDYKVLQDKAYKIIFKLLERLHLKFENIEGHYILFESSELSDYVLSIIEESKEIKRSIIDYLSIKNNLFKKRQNLAYFATQLNLDKNQQTKYSALNNLRDDARCLLNNINIRHNNITNKYEVEAVKRMTDSELMKWSDFTFRKMLAILSIEQDVKIQEEFLTLKKTSFQQKEKLNKIVV